MSPRVHISVTLPILPRVLKKVRLSTNGEAGLKCYKFLTVNRCENEGLCVSTLKDSPGLWVQG